MNPDFFIQQALQAKSVEALEQVQSLWSGYGAIVRYRVNGGLLDGQTVIVKSIEPPSQPSHPRGWNTQDSHQRKIRSYEVELHWYQEWAKSCPEESPLATCYFAHKDSANDHCLIVLSDLDSQGFSQRHNRLDPEQAKVCLDWLAWFHGAFMQVSPKPGWTKDLWPVGTYWHLDTRKDEWESMKESPLKRAAQELDRALSAARYQTLLHGDAKVANFCFTEDGDKVAAVDFQYIGGGCGMKDVIYFLGSCLTPEDCEQHHQALLDRYFLTLKQAVTKYNSDIAFDALEHEWRTLYPLAWADFQRFILGWSPDHAKNNHFSRAITELALKQLGITRT